MNETKPAGRFSWLREKRSRRSGLAEVESALTHGRLDNEGRAALASELRSVRAAGGLSTRESARVARILDALAGGPPALDRSILVRPPESRRGRGGAG